MPGTGGLPLAALLPSWELSLAERDLSPRTMEIYQRTGRQLTAWLAGHGLPADTEGIDAPHLRAFLAAERERTSAVSAHQHYRNLRVLFRWLEREGERQGPNPMARVDPPKVTKKTKAILSADDLGKLLKGCGGQDFESRRDAAILRIFIDTGVRVSGLAGLRYLPEAPEDSDVNLPGKAVRVILKGGNQHWAPLGRKAAAALDRYLRARLRHRLAGSPWLWLGMAGRDPSHFGTAGIQDMIERRGEEAGLGKISPHWFRRTAAHTMLALGYQETDVASIAGWTGTAMVRLYAGELAAERARAVHARLSPGDQI